MRTIPSVPRSPCCCSPPPAAADRAVGAAAHHRRPPVTQPPTEPPGPDPDPPVVDAGPVALRRLTEAQYRATVADVLGDDVVVAGRFEPDNRVSGLLAVGASSVSVTPSGFEQYDTIARGIAAQALDPRTARHSCPASPAAPPTTRARALRPRGRAPPAAPAARRRRARAVARRGARRRGRARRLPRRARGRARGAAAVARVPVPRRGRGVRPGRRRPAPDQPRDGVAPELLPVEHRTRRGAARRRRARRAGPTTGPRGPGRPAARPPAPRAERARVLLRHVRLRRDRAGARPQGPGAVPGLQPADDPRRPGADPARRRRAPAGRRRRLP